MREWDHLHGSIFGHAAKAFRKTNQRAREPPCDVVHGEALDPLPEIHRTLYQQLHQRNRQLGASHQNVFDVRGGPCHHLDGFQGDCNL